MFIINIINTILNILKHYSVIPKKYSMYWNIMTLRSGIALNIYEICMMHICTYYYKNMQFKLKICVQNTTNSFQRKHLII